MSNNYLFIFFLLFLGFAATTVQGQTLKQFERKAQKAFEEQKFSRSLAYFRKAYEMSDDTSYLYNAGRSALELRAYALADTLFDTLQLAPTHKDFLDLNYLHGVANQNMGHYPEAKDYYNKFINSNQSQDPVILNLVNEAQFRIRECEWNQTRGDYTERSLEFLRKMSRANTSGSEFAPYWHEGKLYYSALRFESLKEEYQPCDASLNILELRDTNSVKISFGDEQVSNAHIAFSRDGNRMYYANCECQTIGNYQCQIYIRNKDLASGLWGPPICLPQGINEKGKHATQPNIGYDPATGKEYLFFVSNKKGSRGLDVWCADVDNYDFPVNLQTVNTSKDDITPFFFSDGEENILYLSSNGNPGGKESLGGFDIYAVRNFDFETIAEGVDSIEHLKIPLNTSYDDTYYGKYPDGENDYKILLSSNRPPTIHNVKAEETCCPDIWVGKEKGIQVDVVVRVYNEIARQMNDRREPVLGANVSLTPEGLPAIIPDSIDESGYQFFYYDVELDANYVAAATKTPYWKGDQANVSTFDVTESKVFEIDLFLEPICGVTVTTVKKFPEIDTATLKGNVVQLFDLEIGELPVQNTADNEFVFNPVSCYTPTIAITAKNDVGWVVADSSYMQFGMEYLEPTIVEKQFELIKPLPLFFDHSIPSGWSSGRRYAYKDYGTLFDEYKDRKEMYLNCNPDRQNEIEKFYADAQNGKDRLDRLVDELIRNLENGDTVKIEFRGYASPTGDLEKNEDLSFRRTDSARKYIQQVLKNKGKEALISLIDISTLGLGIDTTATVCGLDAYNDVVYSPEHTLMLKKCFDPTNPRRNLGETQPNETVLKKARKRRCEVYDSSACYSRYVDILGIRIVSPDGTTSFNTPSNEGNRQ